VYEEEELIVVGIDPGLTRCGVAVINLKNPKVGAKRAVEFIQAQVLTTEVKFAHEDRLLQLDDKLNAFFSMFGNEDQVVVAIERPFLTKHNPNTAMGTAQVMGLVMVHSRRRNYGVELFTPPQIKTAVTGNGRADKKQIMNAVSILLGLNSKISAPPDAFDALAIAITCINRGVGVDSALSSGTQNAETEAQRIWKDATKNALKKHLRM
jgi:crossover junction endodeoxyribonuclease RuvC